MLSGNNSPFDVAAQAGATLQLEFISAHARIGGSVSLGAHARLSDLLNFHDEILTVTDGTVLTRSGRKTADWAPELDVNLDDLTLVIDKSEFAPPPDSEQAIEKNAHRVLLVTEAHVITGTFFIYPGAEPIQYLRATEPKWIPLAIVRIRSLIDRRIRYGAAFAVLHRPAVVAASLL